ncbi:IucA/IucC family protein [Baia soyae]|uniref:Siderophore synthetase component n=1 Tax=Baia soyae TaxID=1544746 RepID=A0A4R2SCD8_9BACL|nr:IucA/IucC family siderophore biosynthesis protein [Baia soyae]TCP70566.1 siderophore synthetase component [Baia soyae]
MTINPSIQNIKEILTPAVWEEVSVRLLSKMLSEMMYEDIIQPKEISYDMKQKSYLYELEVANQVIYTYEATKHLFDSYQVIPSSIKRVQGDTTTTATNPLQFLYELQPTIPMSGETAAHLIREYQQTLIADAHILHKKKTKQDLDLTALDYSDLEGMMEGHPWITYNKGRIGFSYEDYLTYAPEQQQATSFLWIAVRKDHTDLRFVEQVDLEALIQEEIGAELANEWKNQLVQDGHLTDDYIFMPVHEWQWDQYLIQMFAEQIATHVIIPMGRGTDEYLPQQSIRTFVNITRKDRYHVKLPMSILNTLVYRGLPSERTVLAPEITTYIQNIYRHDTFLHDEHRVILPGENASINLSHPYFEKIAGSPYQYLELLGCIWRESIYNLIDEGEQPITLASLLYVDGSGKPFIQSLIEKSGLSVEEWMKELFAVLLPPLLHYLYQYGVVFSPHGQNTILVLKDHRPHRLAIKDFVDDVNVSKYPLPELATLSDELRQVLRSEEPEGLCQFIFTGLFVCHFRYLGQLLEAHTGWSEQCFWKEVRSVIESYKKRFPQLEERFEVFDLLRPEFTKLCLNRNRMLDYGYGDDAERPHASEFGKVRNPLAMVAINQ